MNSSIYLKFNLINNEEDFKFLSFYVKYYFEMYGSEIVNNTLLSLVEA